MKRDVQPPQEITKQETPKPEVTSKTKAVPFFGRYVERFKVKTSIRAGEGGEGGGTGKWPRAA